MIKTVVIGSAGRMEKILIKKILKSRDMQLTGAIEAANSIYIGKDAGEVANTKKCSVTIKDNIKSILKNTDVIIDFSTNTMALIENAKIASKAGIAIVIGTSGLNIKEKNSLKQMVKMGGRIACIPNMSLSINLLFNITEIITKAVGFDYDIEIIEMHHRGKKDAPSETTKKFIEIITKARNSKIDTDIKYGRNGAIGIRSQNEIGVHSIRGGDIVGEHKIIFATNGERMEITHKVSDRITFVIGALKAAKFIINSSSGYYNMNDVLGIKNVTKK